MTCSDFTSQAKHRVIVQTRTDTADDYGGTAVAWSTLATVWAAIEPASGREALSDAQLHSRITSKITVRYQAALKNTATAAKYRVSYDSRVFSVKYIKNLAEDMKSEGKAYQVLMCEENDAEN